MLQAALFLGLTLVLIQPSGVPDPLQVGRDYSWTVLCLIGGLAAFALAAAGRLPATRLDVFIWSYVTLTVVTWAFSFDPSAGGKWLFSLAANVAVFYAAVAATRADGTSAAIMLTTVMLGVALLQIVAFEQHLEAGLLKLIFVYLRPEGWNGYPELGLLACVQLAIFIALIEVAPSRLARLWLVAVISITAIELAFLYSRMAWVTAVALLLGAPLTLRSASIRWRWVILAAGIVIVLAVAMSGTQFGRALHGRLAERTAMSERVKIWQRAARMIVDHPLAGVGLGNFEAVHESVYSPMANVVMQQPGAHAHNLWLHIAAEQGLPAAVAYVALWVAALALAWQQRQGSWVQRAAFFILVAMALRSLVDYMFFSTGGAPARLHTLLWMTWGIVAAEPSLLVKSR